jgi:hypothetical protein
LPTNVNDDSSHNQKKIEATPKSLNDSIRVIVIEVISIVLGVLLALAVNEWRANRANTIEAESAMQNVLNELISNQKTLHVIHENNSATVQSMSKDGEDNEESKFIPGLQLKSSSWETLLSTGTSNFVDYDMILLLSDTYSIQKIYIQTGQMLTESAMHMAAYAVVEKKDIDNSQFSKQFYDYLNMLVKVEEELLKSYEKSIALIRAQYQN